MSVSHDDVAAYKGHLLAAGLSTVSVRYKFQALRSFFRFCAGTGVMDIRGLLGTTVSKIRRLSPPVPPAVLDAVLSRLPRDGHRGLAMRCIILLTRFAGLRLREILALRVDDVDFKEGVLRVRRPRGEVTVRLLPPVADVLRRYRHRRPTPNPAHPAVAHTLFLHKGRGGCPFSDHQTRLNIRRMFAAAGYPHRGPLAVLRRQFAADLIAGGNGHMVGKLLGVSHWTVADTKRDIRRAACQAESKIST